jgi:hypothetical protein
MARVLAESSDTCSHQYFHYADATSGSDRNCGCIELAIGSDCEDKMDMELHDVTTVYRVVAATSGRLPIDNSIETRKATHPLPNALSR